MQIHIQNDPQLEETQKGIAQAHEKTLPAASFETLCNTGVGLVDVTHSVQETCRLLGQQLVARWGVLGHLKWC